MWVALCVYWDEHFAFPPARHILGGQVRLKCTAIAT